MSPPDAQRRVQRTADLQWLTARPLTEVLRYRAQAHLHYAYGQQLSDFQRRQHLQLPPDLNPRTTQWAQTLRPWLGARLGVEQRVTERQTITQHVRPSRGIRM